MKIAIVTSHAPSAIYFRGSLISSLVDKGCIVTVFAPNHTRETTTLLNDLGAFVASFPMVRAGISPLRDLLSFLSLFSLFLKKKPDVVLTYFVKPNIWGIFSSFLARVPWRVSIVEGMGYAFTANSFGSRSFLQRVTSWFILLLYRLSFSLSNRVVVLNSDDLNQLVDSSGLSPAKSFLLGGIGVQLDKWPMCIPSTDPITFTMVSRLLKEKGVFEFLDAAYLIHKSYPSVRFCLLGGFDDNPGSITSQQISRWLNQEYISMPGHVDVRPWLQSSSVFVLPSYREGFPFSTQEAMSMGLPVITTDVPGCRETVINDLNGFIVPPRDSLALAHAMHKFISDPSLITHMGMQSRRFAELHFDVRTKDQMLIDLLCNHN